MWKTAVSPLEDSITRHSSRVDVVGLWVSVQQTNSAATTARRDQTSSSSSPPLKCVTGPSSSLAGPPPVVASALPFELTSLPLMTDNHSSLPRRAAGAGEATHRRRREEERRITSDLTDSWRSTGGAATERLPAPVSPSCRRRRSRCLLWSLTHCLRRTKGRASERTSRASAGRQGTQQRRRESARWMDG